MKRASLFAAAAVILVANAFALGHAWSNRSGSVEADLTLTEREFVRLANSTDDDSGVALSLRWDPQQWFGERRMPWLDQKALQELGFDTSVSPSDAKAQEFYQRQRPRRAFVALEYNGPAWRRWIEEVEQNVREHPESPIATSQGERGESASHLIAIDASTDASLMRDRHPDRGSIIIVPAVISIVVGNYYFGGQNRGQAPPRLAGAIQDIPSSIHIPLPFSQGFRRQPPGLDHAKYRVHLRYGSSLEPWIVGVNFASPASP